MFEIFDEHARRVLFFARLANAELGGSQLTETHLLHGVLRDRPMAVTRFVADAGWTAERLRRQVESLAPGEPRLPTDVELPFAEGFKQLMIRAAARAKAAGRSLVPEDLVRALLDEPDTTSARLLAEAGVTSEAIDAWLRTL